jgi:hypothetical protein
VTDTGRVVRFSDRDLPAISTPVAVSGLRAGDAIIALDRAPSGELLTLGRSSAIYTLDPRTGRASQRLAPFTGSIDSSAPVTFSIAPDGTTAPPPAYAPGDPHAGQTPALAADALSDGRLAAHRDFVVQQSAGGPLTTSTVVPGALENPTRVTVAPDGSVWLAAKLGANNGREYHQTRLVRFDPATGRVSRANGPYLSIELVALAAVGPMPVPTAPPQAQITLPTANRCARSTPITASSRACACSKAARSSSPPATAADGRSASASTPATMREAWPSPARATQGSARAAAPHGHARAAPLHRARLRGTHARV